VTISTSKRLEDKDLNKATCNMVIASDDFCSSFKDYLKPNEIFASSMSDDEVQLNPN
jgi:hypothetical protein